jgi:hypothetical protein
MSGRGQVADASKQTVPWSFCYLRDVRLTTRPRSASRDTHHRLPFHSIEDLAEISAAMDAQSRRDLLPVRRRHHAGRARAETLPGRLIHGYPYYQTRYYYTVRTLIDRGV